MHACTSLSALQCNSHCDKSIAAVMNRGRLHCLAKVAGQMPLLNSNMSGGGWAKYWRHTQTGRV